MSNMIVLTSTHKLTMNGLTSKINQHTHTHIYIYIVQASKFGANLYFLLKITLKRNIFLIFFSKRWNVSD